MKKVGINKATSVLSWIFVIITALSFVLALSAGNLLMENADEITDLAESNDIEGALEESEDVIVDTIGAVAVLGLVMLVAYGVAIAGLVVSIISLVKCNKLGLNKTGSILCLIGFGVFILFSSSLFGYASIVLVIIGAIMMRKVYYVSEVANPTPVAQ